jgi:dipeptidyl aminopeptidase/acylaminoacyl peptidase
LNEENSMASKKRRVEPADLFRIKSLCEAKLSPDATRALYAVSHVDAEKGEEYISLWLLSLETRATRQLTSGLARDYGAAWSPDGSRIAFLSTRGGAPQVYVLPVDGGEARALTALTQGVEGAPVWSPGGSSLAFAAVPAREAMDATQPYRVDRPVYRFDRLGVVDRVAQDLYVIDAEGGEPRRLTDDRCHNFGPLWSPDGKEILFSSLFEPDSHNMFVSFKVVTLEGVVHPLVNNAGFAQVANWTPDGKQVVFTGAPNGRPYGSKNDLWLMNRDGTGIECRTTGLKLGVNGSLQGDFPVPWTNQDNPLQVSEDGQEAFLHIQEGGTKHIYRFALSGSESWTAVTAGERTCAFMDLVDGRVLYAASSLDNPADLYVVDVDGGNERRLTSLNDDLLAEWELPAVEHLLFSSEDGEQVEGWMMKPAVGEPPYPTILYAHGGPYAGFGHLFSFDFQMLAGAGYGVLFINHRGSSGYGDEFSLAITGDWGNLDYKDLMAGVDVAIERGLADPNGLGVCGLSGGGFLSCWMVGHTDRFKAAVPENPLTNWVSQYGVSDVGPVLGVQCMGGAPHEIPEVYTRCSPITYAHRCKTPTLLIQAESDHRCPPEQSEQFFTVLKANGCVAEMLRLPNEFHEGSITGGLPARRAQNEALLDWMNRYVMGKNPSSRATAQAKARPPSA